MHSQRSRILISEWMEAEAVGRLRTAHDVLCAPELAENRAELLRAVQDVEALIVRNRTQVNRELLEAAPSLRVIGRLGVGLDNIDLGVCDVRNVQVIPATGANARSVAEYVLFCAMLLLRGTGYSTPAVGSGLWPREALMRGREIAGKTLGVVGFGSVGRCTAELATRAGMRAIYYSSARLPDAVTAQHVESLQALLKESDVVSIHVPLTAATRGLIGSAELSLMRSDAILINSARGGIVDETALIEELHRGRIGGAAVDVFETEPLPAVNPWRGCPNLLLTPHIAGLTRESNQRVSDFIAERVLQALASPVTTGLAGSDSPSLHKETTQ